jgi:hypothetical protein
MGSGYKVIPAPPDLSKVLKLDNAELIGHIAIATKLKHRGLLTESHLDQLDFANEHLKSRWMWKEAHGKPLVPVKKVAISSSPGKVYPGMLSPVNGWEPPSRVPKASSKASSRAPVIPVVDTPKGRKFREE